MKKVIVVIDMQNDFIDGSLGTKEAQAMLPRLVAKLAREREAALIFTQDTHGASYLETQEGIAPALAPYAARAAAIIEKPAFGSLALPEAVRSLRPEAIELTGLCTDICVIANAMILKAAFPEIPISVDASCCAGVTPDSHENALAAMKMCQVRIVR